MSWGRWVLLCGVLAGPALAAEPRFELTVLPFDVAFTAPGQVAGAEVGPSRTFGTSGALELYFTKRVGVRLLGGASWYSALGARAGSSFGGKVLLPAWWGFGGVVFRFEPARLAWLTLHAEAGVNEAMLALGELPDAVVRTASASVQGAGQLAAALHVRLEAHVAFRLELRVSLFGAPVNAWGCSTGELARLAAQADSGADLRAAGVPGTCRVSEIARPADVALARTELQDTRFFLGGSLGIAAGFVFR